MKLGPFLRKRYTGLHEIVRKIVTIFDYSLWALMDPSKFKKIKNEEIHSILVSLIIEKDGNIGGNFCTLGVINQVAAENSRLKISILSDKKTISQFGKVPGVEFIEYQGSKTIKEIKKRNFDALIYLEGGPLSIRDFKFIPYRIGRSSSDLMALLSTKDKMLFTRKIFVPWGMHMVESRYRMFEVLGFEFKNMRPRVYFSNEEDKKVLNFIKNNKIKKYIVIHPGGKYVTETLRAGKWPPHLWPVERYAEVADYFIKRGYSVIMTGAPEEDYLADLIRNKMNGKLINVAGRFSLREAAALLSHAESLIATDTGIAHIAYQTGVPIVELMGPSCPEIVGIWPIKSSTHEILFDDGPCARSMKKRECPEEIVCLGKITSESVIKACERVLRNKKEKRF